MESALGVEVEAKHLRTNATMDRWEDEGLRQRKTDTPSPQCPSEGTEDDVLPRKSKGSTSSANFFECVSQNRRSPWGAEKMERHPLKGAELTSDSPPLTARKPQGWGFPTAPEIEDPAKPAPSGRNDIATREGTVGGTDGAFARFAQPRVEEACSRSADIEIAMQNFPRGPERKHPSSQWKCNRATKLAGGIRKRVEL